MATTTIERCPAGARIKCPDPGCPGAATVEAVNPRHLPMTARPAPDAPAPGPAQAGPAVGWFVICCERTGRKSFARGTPVELIGGPGPAA
jgi:hypothetical protein